jgi:predicted component of type VI protein secretion system
MKPLEIVLAFVVLAFVIALSFGGGAYWQSSRVALPDTVRTIEYVKVPVQTGVAKPREVIRTVRDTVRIEVVRTPDGTLLSNADYDSLTAPRAWTIDGEYIGHMDLEYDPLERILSYSHTPPPIKIETVEVTREVPVSFWQKAEYVAYGVAGGIVLTLLIGHN